MSLEVVIVQHAEKKGEPGDPGLTTAGRQQATQTACYLAAATSPLGLYSSPMRRALETASPIAELLQLDVEIDPRLRERMNWEGNSTQSIEEFLLEWERANIDRDFTPVAGDSSRVAGARFLAAIDEMAKRHGEGLVVVVAHGGVTTDLLRTLISDVGVGRVAPTLIADGVACCALSRLAKTGTGWTVAEIASTAHLDRDRCL